jgi:hypothetical protein
VFAQTARIQFIWNKHENIVYRTKAWDPVCQEENRIREFRNLKVQMKSNTLAFRLAGEFTQQHSIQQSTNN